MIELLWNAPVSEIRMSEILEALALEEGQQVLDIGCGCGEILIRLAERYQILGTGIDVSPAHISEACRRMQDRIPDAAVQFISADIKTVPLDQNAYDLVLCLGSTHAFASGGDAFQNALQQMVPLVKSGGQLLIADGYLKQPAVPEYRAYLGEAIPEGMTHAANVTTGQHSGLIPYAAWTSTIAEWDDFEWAYQRIIEQSTLNQPDNQELTTKLQQRRAWIQAYLKWGRDTLGYGLYLFQKP